MFEYSGGTGKRSRCFANPEKVSRKSGVDFRDLRCNRPPHYSKSFGIRQPRFRNLSRRVVIEAGLLPISATLCPGWTLAVLNDLYDDQQKQTAIGNQGAGPPGR